MSPVAPAEEPSATVMERLVQLRDLLAARHTDLPQACTAISNNLLLLCFEKNSIIPAIQQMGLRDWLCGCLMNIGSNLFNDEFDDGRLEQDKGSVFRFIKKLRLDKAAASAYLATMDNKEDSNARRVDDECTVLLYSSAIALLYVRNYSAVQKCFIQSMEDFSIQFGGFIVNETTQTTMLQNCEPRDQHILLLTAHWMRLTLLAIPARPNTEKIIDVSSRLAEGEKYSRGGGKYATGFLRRRALFNFFTESRPTPRQPNTKRTADEAGISNGDIEVELLAEHALQEDPQVFVTVKTARSDMTRDEFLNYYGHPTELPAENTVLTSTAAVVGDSMGAFTNGLLDDLPKEMRIVAHEMAVGGKLLWQSVEHTRLIGPGPTASQEELAFVGVRFSEPNLPETTNSSNPNRCSDHDLGASEQDGEMCDGAILRCSMSSVSSSAGQAMDVENIDRGPLFVEFGDVCPNATVEEFQIVPSPDHLTEGNSPPSHVSSVQTTRSGKTYRRVAKENLDRLGDPTLTDIISEPDPYYRTNE
jgi:hypothetical protein